MQSGLFLFLYDMLLRHCDDHIEIVLSTVTLFPIRVGLASISSIRFRLSFCFGCALWFCQLLAFLGVSFLQFCDLGLYLRFRFLQFAQTLLFFHHLKLCNGQMFLRAATLARSTSVYPAARICSRNRPAAQVGLFENGFAGFGFQRFAILTKNGL